MAKNWVVSEDMATLTRNYSEKYLNKETLKEEWRKTAEPLVFELDALVISTDFQALDEVEKLCFINGLKQKLDDTTARSKDMTLSDPEKREIQEAMWLRLVEDRKWNAESKTKGPRSESVGLKLVVPEFLKLGLSAEKIAGVMKKPVEVIRKFIETGVDDSENE